MKNIALRYSDNKLTNLTFDDVALNQTQFETVKCTLAVVNTTEESGVLLNGRKYNHLLYKHRDFEITISSDELDSTIIDFLQDFWTARFKYVSFKKGSLWGAYTQIMTESGKFPISYIDDIKDLPEITFNLSYADPI